MRIGLIIISLILLVGPAIAQTDLAPADSTVHGRDFDLKCELCHTPEGWRVMRPEIDFDHSSTGFSLVGRHRSVDCTACHNDLEFRRIGVLCADCHKDELHQGGLGFDCARCHTEQGWHQPAAQRLLHQQTRFPLLGRHGLIDCDACHKSEQKDEYAHLPVDCWTCHATNYAETSFPDHNFLGFSTDCQECHNMLEMKWTDVNFQHTSSFPLIRSHGIGDCQVCHVNPREILVGNDCYNCHQADYNATSNPPHIANLFPTDCTACHDTGSFDNPDYYSHPVSGFPRTGQHALISCRTCHNSGQYRTLDGSCYSCHQADYDGTENPDHMEIGYPIDCERCHNPAAWSQVKKNMTGRVR